MPKFTTTFTDANGLMWERDQFGNVKPVMHDGQQLRGAPNTVLGSNTSRTSTSNRTTNTANNPVIKALIDSENNAITDAQKRRAELENRRRNSTNLQDQTELDAQIEALNKDIATRQQRIQDYIKSSLPTGTTQPTDSNVNKTSLPRLGSSSDIGSNMLAGINGGKIFSPFGKKRSNGKIHMGADYAVPGGSHILVHDVGTQLTVKSVGTDPRHSYGNHVRLEGNLNGHTIEVLVAHMGNNSVKLQQGQKVNPGELIGLVGNTGNTSDKSRNGAITTWYEGKNSGYHMHLETILDGKYINPVEFFNKIAPYITKQQPRVPVSTTAMIPEGTQSGDVTTTTTTGNQGGNTIPDNVMFTHPTEKPITIEMFNNFLRNAEAGKYDNVHNRDDLIKYFQKKGYTLNEKFIQNPVSTTTSPDTPPANIAGTTSDDITAPIVTVPTDSADVAATQPQPRTTNNPAQPRYTNESSLYSSRIPLPVPAFTHPSKSPYREEDFYEAVQEIMDENGVSYSEAAKGFYNWLISQGYKVRDDFQIMDNNDANLASVMGIGDSAHSPGPVHREETRDSIQHQIDGLNGETSSDITPRNTGSPSWSSFMPPMGINFNSRFARTPYPNTREYRIG